MFNSGKHLEMNCSTGKCGSKMGDHTCASVKKETSANTKITEGKCVEKVNANAIKSMIQIPLIVIKRLYQ